MTCEHDLCESYDSCIFEGRMFVNVYELSLSYGGPEEGGWWTTCGEFVHGEMVNDGKYEDVVKSLEDAYPQQSQGRSHTSVNYQGGDYRVYVEDSPGESFPSTMPHYE